MGFIATAAKLATPLLNIPLIRRTRRNHGLEHASIHLLSGRVRNLRMAGRSDGRGFLLYGNVATADVEWAVYEALRRMRSGEHRLAIHPNCGTNLLTTGLLTTLAATVGMVGTGEKWAERLARLPTALLLVITALVFSPPLGMALQLHFTTLGDPGSLEVATITRHELSLPFSAEKLTVHRVETRAG